MTMTLPPWWKIKREFFRIFDPVGLWLQRPLERFQTIYHDRNFDRKITVTTEKLPDTGKVAVFVIFQPKGIAKSTLLTLGFLRSNGYQPIVVCNGPHLKSDIALLASHATAVVQRPNIGYDFGAYRDGQKIIGKNLYTLDRLVLMNDSTWFPLRSDDSTITRMEESDADMIGHIFKTESTQKRGHDHIESHFLMFKGAVVASPTYKNFWRKYAMSNQRVTTIRYGEKHLTQTMIKNGFDCRGLLSREVLLSHLSRLDKEALRQYAMAVVHHKDHVASYFADLLDRWDEPTARPEFLEWVSSGLKATRQYLVSTTFIEPAIRLGKMGFIKKGKDSHFHMARARLLDLSATGVIPKIDPIIEAEIRAAVDEYERKQ